MSIKLMVRAFDPDIPVEGTEQVLLLKLCDLANDDGWCWPGVRSLATAIRREERQTQKLIRKLKDRGLIEVIIGGGQHHTNRYRITLPPKVESTGSTGNGKPHQTTPSQATPFPGTPSASDVKPRPPATGTPSSSDRNGALASAPEPSRTVMNPHPPSAPGGVGVSTSSVTSDQQRQFLRGLTRLGVADGPKAAHRWWVQSGMSPLVETFAHRMEMIDWCVTEARRRGKSVSYASDIVDLIGEWAPEELLGIDNDQPAPASPA